MSANSFAPQQRLVVGTQQLPIRLGGGSHHYHQDQCHNQEKTYNLQNSAVVKSASCLFSVNDEATGSVPSFDDKEDAGMCAGDVFSFKTRIGEEDDEELDVNVKAC